MNRSKLFILLTLFAFSGLLMLVTSSARAWRVSISDCSGCASRAEAVVVDAAGDVIATGSFFYGSDVVKLSGATGQLRWRFNASGYESRTYVQDLAIDSNGDVFVVFAYSRTVIKVSGATGNQIWAKLIDGTLNACQSHINAVAVDRDNNVVTAGTIGCLLNVAKLDGRTGDEKWHYEREGLAKAVAVDPFGNVAAAGLMNRNFAVVRLSGESGEELWQPGIREIDGAGTFSNSLEEANAVAMDKDGNVLVAGVTSNESMDFTVAKYLPDGTARWVENINGQFILENDHGELLNQSNDRANAVAIDKDGNVIAAGSIQEDDDVPATIPPYPYPRAPEHFRVVKIASDGGVLWSMPAEDPPSGEEYSPGHAFAVSVDNVGDVVAGGEHEGRFTVVKFQNTTGARLWPPHQLDSGGSGNGNNALSIVADTARDIVAAGEIIGPDGWQKFTVVKLRGTDGTDYFATPTPGPTPDVPEPVKAYAPLVHLFATEQYWPAEPLDFIRHSDLRWSHEGCRDHSIPESPSVNPYRLGGNKSERDSVLPYSHPARGFRLLGICSHSDIDFTTLDHTRPHDDDRGDDRFPFSIYPKEGFYLDLTNEDIRTGIESSSSDPTIYTGPTLYYEYAPGAYITYWFFYAYNRYTTDDVPIPPQAHEGDWERISVLLDYCDNPIAVKYYQHRRKEIMNWSEVINPDGHPIVFSANGSHASYSSEGRFPTDLCSETFNFCAYDYTGSNGREWRTWTTPLADITKQPWYGYGGAWGEIGDGYIFWAGEYTGPLGPSIHKTESWTGVPCSPH